MVCFPHDQAIETFRQKTKVEHVRDSQNCPNLEHVTLYLQTVFPFKKTFLHQECTCYLLLKATTEFQWKKK